MTFSSSARVVYDDKVTKVSALVKATTNAGYPSRPEKLAAEKAKREGPPYPVQNGFRVQAVTVATRVARLDCYGSADTRFADPRRNRIREKLKAQSIDLRSRRARFLIRRLPPGSNTSRSRATTHSDFRMDCERVIYAFFRLLRPLAALGKRRFRLDPSQANGLTYS